MFKIIKFNHFIVTTRDRTSRDLRAFKKIRMFRYIYISVHVQKKMHNNVEDNRYNGSQDTRNTFSKLY